MKIFSERKINSQAWPSSRVKKENKPSKYVNLNTDMQIEFLSILFLFAHFYGFYYAQWRSQELKLPCKIITFTASHSTGSIFFYLEALAKKNCILFDIIKENISCTHTTYIYINFFGFLFTHGCFKNIISKRLVPVMQHIMVKAFIAQSSKKIKIKKYIFCLFGFCVKPLIWGK